VTASGPEPGPGGAGAGAAARSVRARRFQWLERRLFEVLGGWVPTVPEPDVKLALRSHSFQHAWHAALWADLLPTSQHGATASAAPDGALAPVLDAVAEPSGTLARLVGAYRVVLPRVVTAYAGQVEEASPLSEGPLVRALNLMLADDVEAWRVGEGLVQRCLMSAADAELAARHAARIEALWVAVGA
jgi:hypothetical protein